VFINKPLNIIVGGLEGCGRGGGWGLFAGGNTEYNKIEKDSIK